MGIPVHSFYSSHEDDYTTTTYSDSTASLPRPFVTARDRLNAARMRTHPFYSDVSYSRHETVLPSDEQLESITVSYGGQVNEPAIMIDSSRRYGFSDPASHIPEPVPRLLFPLNGRPASARLRPPLSQRIDHLLNTVLNQRQSDASSSHQDSSMGSNDSFLDFQEFQLPSHLLPTATATSERPLIEPLPEPDIPTTWIPTDTETQDGVKEEEWKFPVDEHPLRRLVHIYKRAHDRRLVAQRRLHTTTRHSGATTESNHLGYSTRIWSEGGPYAGRRVRQRAVVEGDDWEAPSRRSMEVDRIELEDSDDTDLDLHGIPETLLRRHTLRRRRRRPLLNNTGNAAPTVLPPDEHVPSAPMDSLPNAPLPTVNQDQQPTSLLRILRRRQMGLQEGMRPRVESTLVSTSDEVVQAGIHNLSVDSTPSSPHHQSVPPPDDEDASPVSVRVIERTPSNLLSGRRLSMSNQRTGLYPLQRSTTSNGHYRPRLDHDSLFRRMRERELQNTQSSGRLSHGSVPPPDDDSNGSSSDTLSSPSYIPRPVTLGNLGSATASLTALMATTFQRWQILRQELAHAAGLDLPPLPEPRSTATTMTTTARPSTLTDAARASDAAASHAHSMEGPGQ